MLPLPTAIATPKHGHLGDDVHGAWGRTTDLDPMQIHGVIADVETVGDRFPALTSVVTGQQATDLDRGVHVLRSRGVRRHADDALPQRWHVSGDMGEDDFLGVHLLPMLAAIFR